MMKANDLLTKNDIVFVFVCMLDGPLPRVIDTYQRKVDHI